MRRANAATLCRAVRRRGADRARRAAGGSAGPHAHLQPVRHPGCRARSRPRSPRPSAGSAPRSTTRCRSTCRSASRARLRARGFPARRSGRGRDAGAADLRRADRGSAGDGRGRAEGCGRGLKATGARPRSLSAVSLRHPCASASSTMGPSRAAMARQDVRPGRVDAGGVHQRRHLRVAPDQEVCEALGRRVQLGADAAAAIRQVVERDVRQQARGWVRGKPRPAGGRLRSRPCAPGSVAVGPSSTAPPVVFVRCVAEPVP